MESYKVVIDTHLSCLNNLIRSSMIYRYLIENGHEIVFDDSIADYIIINSCGVTKEMQKRYFSHYKKYYTTKKKNAKIILYGCLVKINKKIVKKMDALPIGLDDNENLDHIFSKKIKFENMRPICDNETKNILIKAKKQILIKKGIRGDLRYTIISNAPFILSSFFLPFSKKMRYKYHIMRDPTSIPSFFIEISRGCTGNCAYCVIKRAKGNINSRDTEDIFSDIEQIDNSSKNLVLVADDCSSYGVEKGEDLLELVNEIHNKFPDLTISLSYLSPDYLEKEPKKHIKLFKEINIGWTSIPIQSGSNRIVKKMNRDYNIGNVIKIIDNIKKSSNTIFLTNFIIGYPGENTRDFIKSVSVSRYFDMPSPFIYSDMRGTLASKLPQKKSVFTITTRLLIFYLFMNLFVFYKLVSNK